MEYLHLTSRFIDSQQLALNDKAQTPRQFTASRECLYWSYFSAQLNDLNTSRSKIKLCPVLQLLYLRYIAESPLRPNTLH